MCWTVLVVISLVIFPPPSCLLSIQVFRVGAIWTNQSHLHLPLTLLKLNKKSDYKLKCRFCSTNGTDTIAIAFSQKYILSVLFTVIFYYLATFPLYFFFANYDVFKTFPTLLIIREIQLDRLKSTQQTRLDNNNTTLLLSQCKTVRKIQFDIIINICGLYTI